MEWFFYLVHNIFRHFLNTLFRNGGFQMHDVLEVILRSIGAFCLLLIRAKILGKQTISKMTTFDFVASISLGAIAKDINKDDAALCKTFCKEKWG